MSAYLVNPNRIGILAQAIAARVTPQGDAMVIAHILASENLRSVAYRYRTNADGAAQQFMDMDAAEYCLQCRTEATDPVNDPAGVNRMSIAALTDLAGTYAYQSCECDDWPETAAAQLLKVITTPQHQAAAV